MVSEWNSGKPETVCGKGSQISETKLIRKLLPEIFSRYNITTIADVGCGDQNWLKLVNLTDRTYDGFDIKPRNKTVHEFNCLSDILPNPYDLVMCIYMLNHLYEPEAMDRAIENFKASKSRLLLSTFNTVDYFPLEPIEQIFHKTKRSGAIERDWYYGVFVL